MEETLGTLIVLGGMFAVMLLAYLFNPGAKKTKGGEVMNTKFYEHGDVIDVGRKFTDVQPATPYGVSEKSLVAKRDKALQKASRKAKLTWRDKKHLRKLASTNLVALTQETSEDLKDAMRAKFQSDLNVFVSAHNMRNIANLERLRLAFEDALTEAYAESSRHRMNAKMKVLLVAIDKMDRKVDGLKKTLNKGNGKYTTMILESYDRILQDTIGEIESIKVRLNHPQFTD